MEENLRFSVVQMSSEYVISLHRYSTDAIRAARTDSQLRRVIDRHTSRVIYSPGDEKEA